MLDTGIARPPSPTYTAITPVTRAPEKKRAGRQARSCPREETVGPSAEPIQADKPALGSE